MKTLFAWVFWGFIIIAGWRWAGPSIRDFIDEASCIYQNYAGTCLSQKAYIKMVAHDAATDALIELGGICSNSFTKTDPRCSLFHPN